MKTVIFLLSMGLGLSVICSEADASILNLRPGQVYMGKDRDCAPVR